MNRTDGLEGTEGPPPASQWFVMTVKLGLSSGRDDYDPSRVPRLLVAELAYIAALWPSV